MPNSIIKNANSSDYIALKKEGVMYKDYSKIRGNDKTCGITNAKSYELLHDYKKGQKYDASYCPQ